MALVIIFRNNILDVAWPLLLVYGFFFVTGFVLVAFKIHLLSAMPSWAASFASAIGSIWNHLFASKERDHLKDAFTGAVSPVLLDQLVESKKIPSLQGENREVTALVTDINDFSTLASKFDEDPFGLQRLLNRYHTEMTAIVQDHGGYVNKYIGDSIICLFGAPFTQPDHAQRACKAALAIVSRAKELSSFIPELGAGHQTRVGVSSATMFVGNFGSDQRVDYSAVGDEMRVAARIERENENLGTQILVSHRTMMILGSKAEVRPAATLELLEGSARETIYELVDVR
jgi:adenylate cyclase